MSAGDRTKKLIVNELKAMCETTTLRKITVKDIIEHCGINKGTFYYHFANKQELINYVYHLEVTIPLRKLFVNCIENWDTLTLTSLRLMNESKSFYIQAFKMRGQNDIISFVDGEVKENWRIVTRKYIEHHYGQIQLSHKKLYYVSDFLASGATSMMISWVLSGMEDSPEEIAALLDLGTEFGLKKSLDYVVRQSV